MTNKINEMHALETAAEDKVDARDAVVSAGVVGPNVPDDEQDADGAALGKGDGTDSGDTPQIAAAGTSDKRARKAGQSRRARLTEESGANSTTRVSKTEAALKLLRRKTGASLAELQEATGWQAHSVRGFLSGTVRKRLALALSSEVTKQGVRRYRIGADAKAG
jgi:hypothetical protein